MAITTRFLTGLEHGLYSVNGGGIFDVTTGAAPTVTSTNPRSGTYALSVTCAGSGGACDKTGLTADAKRVARFAFRITTLPTNASGNVVYLDDQATLKLTSGGVLSMTLGATTVNGPTLTTGRYYCIEYQLDISGTTWTVDWKVDGASQTQVSEGGHVASTTTLIRFGHTTSTATYSYLFDDIIVGAWTASTDWYGDGRVLSYLPGSDGTHSIAGSQFSFGEAGTAFSSTSTAWTMVDDAPPWTTTRSTTDNLGQRITGTSNYLEIAPVTPTEITNANAVRALLAYSSLSTTANTAGCDVRNSAGTTVAILGTTGAPVAWNVSSNNFKGAIVTVPAAGWTPAEVAAIRWRFGYSNDISPVPTCQALMLEVDWPVALSPHSRRVTALTLPPSPAGFS